MRKIILSLHHEIFSTIIFFTFSLFVLSEELELLDTCVCWCQQWAEVHIRKPTGMLTLITFLDAFVKYSLLLYVIIINAGDTSWLTRIQNDVNTISDFDPITDIGALYEATVINEQIKLENTDVDIEVS